MPEITDTPGTAPRDEKDRPPKVAPKPKPKPASRPRIGERREDGSKVRSADDTKLITELTGLYQGIGTVIGGIGVAKTDAGLMGTGATMANNGEAAAQAWLDYADQNPKIKAWLKRITEASAVGSLVAVHVAMAMPLLVDRGVIPNEAAAVAGVMFHQETTAT